MVYQRVQKAAPINPQHDTPIKKQQQKIQPLSASSSGLSAQQRIDSLPDVPANWMSLDPVMRRIQDKAAAMQLAASQEDELHKTADSPAVDTDAVQMKCSQCEEKEKVQLHADEETQLTGDDLHEQVQLHANGHNGAKSIQQLAAQGFSGSATTLPHLNQIQQSFGVNLSHVQAYIGGAAAGACNQMGAAAYASGNQIAFKEAPSVELAAHEAAHVVQQQSGKVQLSGGVGKVGDKYEQHADDVAARVGTGQSAGDLLAEYTGNTTQNSIQMKNSDLNQQFTQRQEQAEEGQQKSLVNKERTSLTGQQEGLFHKENLYAQAGVFDRGPRPGKQGPPNPENCRQIIFDILVLLVGGTLEKVILPAPKGQDGKTVTRTMWDRHRQMRKDTDLYRNHKSEMNSKPGVGSWDGHKLIYENRRKALKSLIESWKRGGCGGLNKIRAVDKDELNEIIKEAEYWANKPAPDKPDNVDSFELPQITLPELDLNMDWIWPIFRILWGNEQTV